VQYADFALWQRELLGDISDEGSVAARQLEFWRGVLEGVPDRLDLPSDRVRPAVRTLQGATHHFTIPADVHRKIVALARTHSATPFMVVHAALATTLARLSGTDDITIGTPVAGRGEQHLDNLVGMFVNTLVLRTQFDADMTFVQLLDATRSGDLDAFAHSDIPFEQLVEALEPVRATSHSPLFQVLLAFQNLGRIDMELPGLRIESLDADAGASQFDLQFILSEHYDDEGVPDEISSALTYATDLFDADTARMFADRFLRVLDGVVSDPDSPVADVTFLDPDERETLIAMDGRDAVAPQRLYEIFTAAAQSGDHAAVVADGHTTTYRELDAASNLLARALIDQGVGPGVYVPVSLARSLDLIVAVWAVAKAGGAFLPVDPGYPESRITHMVRDSGASIGLTTSAWRSGLPDDVSWIELDGNDFERGALQNRYSDSPITDADRRAPVRIDDIAYVIYTSGSTGLPKGVAVSHRGVMNLMREQVETLRVDQSSRVLHVSTPSFDASIFEWLTAFGGAATVVVAPPTAYAGEELAALLRAERVTHAVITPAVLQSVNPDGLDDLHVVVTAGDACPPDLVAKWITSTGERVMFNAYGPSEATVMATLSAPMVPGAPIDIGGPTRGFRIFVLDARLQPVPIGVPGELYLSGPGLARGYHDRAALTSTAFTANPFADGERMYRTGDLVRWTKNHTLEFVGRVDFQVKIRGQRIEIGEVEAVLAAHPDVVSVVVVARDDRAGGPYLAGYVVPRPGVSVDIDSVRRHAAQKLPDYMVPTGFVVLEKLPLTPAGKLDRRGLPAPAAASPVVSRAPEGPIETELAQLFSEVLNLDSVGADDSFFGLGGDSIVSIQLVSRAKAHGLIFTPRDVFERKTVAALAQVVATAGESGEQIIDELPGSGVGTVPATPIMEWFLGKGGPLGRFAQSMLLHAPTPMNEPRLAATVAAVVARHDMLRARLVRSEEHAPYLEVPDSSTIDVDALVRSVRTDHRPGTSEFEAFVASELDAGADRLDPESGVMVQVVSIAPSDPDSRPGDGRILAIIHHLVVDAVSWRIIVPDLATAWHQQGEPDPDALAPIGTSFRTWSSALTAAAHTRDAEIPYWQSIVDTDEPALGSRRLDPAIDVAGSAESIDVEFDTHLTEALLTTVPAAVRSGVDTGLLAGLAMAVADGARQSASQNNPGQQGAVSTVIHREAHGREEHAISGGDAVRADLGRTVGWFTTLFPVRLDASNDVVATLKTVKEQLLAVPDRGIGYGMLRYLTDTPELSEGAAPQVSFNYLGRSSSTDGGEHSAWLPDHESGNFGGAHDHDMSMTALIEINASVVDTSAGPTFRATWTYAPGAITADEVRALADRWQTKLREIADLVAAAPVGLTPSDVPLVDLDQPAIDRIVQQYPNVAQIWPLSPLQEGLLFHALLAHGTADTYTVQLTLDLVGTVDAELMRTAGQGLLDRHANLRTAFVRAAGNPVQVVLDHVELPWKEIDLTEDSEGDRHVQLDRIMTRDRAAGFAMEKAPLIRFTLVHTGPESSRLIITNHHILLDGWSTPLLVRELFTSYVLGSAGQHPLALDGVLPRVRPYRDFLEWLSRQDRDASLQAWRDALAGSDEPTLIAATGRESQAQVEVPTRQLISLSPAVTDQIDQFTRSHGVTINTLIQVAWAAVLAGQLGRDDVTFGATVSGRPAQIGDVETMVGLLVNTLPVRIHLDPTATVTQLLSRVQNEQSALLDHHYLGLADIQQEAGAGAVFDTITVYESYPVDSAGLTADSDLGGIRVVRAEGLDATHYPMSVVAARDDRLHVRVDHLPSLVDDTVAAAMAARLERALLAFAESAQSPDRRLSDIDLLGADERARLVPARGPKALAPRTLAEVFAAAVDGSGTSGIEDPAPVDTDADRIAVVLGDQQYSYRELDARSNALAAALRAQGVGPDTMVAVALPRSLESVLCLWAVAKAGGAFVPVDPRYPRERIAAMVSDSGIGIGITSADQIPTLPTQVRWLDIHDVVLHDDAALDWDVSGVVAGEVTPEHLAYVIYTSGSTGRPKGVEVPQRGIVNVTAEVGDRLGTTVDSKVLHFASPSFDAALFEVLIAVSGGATLVIAPPTVLGGDELAELIREQGVTHAFMTPSALASMDPKALGDLRTIVVGGEACPPELIGRFAREGRALINGYGPSEGTIAATLSEPMVPAGVAPIGTAVRGFELLVLDRHLQPVPSGVTGELYLSGSALARGYSGRTDLTADRFVSNPFGAPGSRMYRTGDLVRWRGAGEDASHTPVLEYVGRSDFQIKVRGFRIELGEIDAALVSHPSVEFAVTLGYQRAHSDTVLVSYVLPVSGEDIDAAVLTAHVADAVPSYMVPSHIVALDEIPLTPAGKLDRRALPEPDFSERRQEYVAPRTDTEDVVAQVFAEVLGSDQVGRTDDFFALGGNSLSATRVAGLLAERLGGLLGDRVPVQAVLTNPTVEGLAALLDSADLDSQAVRSLDVVLPLQVPGPDDAGLQPLFCVHSVIGLSWSYAGLAQHVGTNRPIYGLQSPYVCEAEELGSITELAQRYVREIRSVQPEGPYHLVGWSLGGAIAHEIAVQLQESGQSVHLLAMLDSYAPGRAFAEIDETATLTDVLGGFADIALPAGRSDSETTFDDIATQVEALGLFSRDVLERIQHSFVSAPEWVNSHPGRVFQGDVVFFTAIGHGPTRPDPALTWKSWVSGHIHRYPVSATHWEMTSADALGQIGPAIDAHIPRPTRPGAHDVRVSESELVSSR
ncbi:MAG: amino acid adenylation domain-containing protein, partial [Rhodococcus sp.]|nr:amino acid adenylation domain-containing protein [Rhodococcus sp. (in: high G+C Gram-positive bacteria)]